MYYVKVYFLFLIDIVFPFRLFGILACLVKTISEFIARYLFLVYKKLGCSVESIHIGRKYFIGSVIRLCNYPFYLGINLRSDLFAVIPAMTYISA